MQLDKGNGGAAPRSSVMTVRRFIRSPRRRGRAVWLADFRHWRRAQVRFTEYDHVLKPVPSQNLAAGETQ
jgi:hypothetical protein